MSAADALDLLHEVHASAAAMLEELRELKPELARLQSLPRAQLALDDLQVLTAARLILERLRRDEQVRQQSYSASPPPDWNYSNALERISNPYEWEQVLRTLHRRAKEAGA